jgi:outer membrane protein W
MNYKMKKSFIIIICLSFFAVNANSQTTHKRIRMDAGTGYAIPNNGGGLLISLEPKYAVTERINAGLKWEMDFIMKKFNEAGNTVDAKAQHINSYLATGDFYLLTKNFRPFVGAGAGIYRISAVEAAVRETGTGNISEKTNFGGLLRAGFDIRHFRLTLAFNMAGKDGGKNKAGFFSVSVHAYIGGGKKEDAK